MSMLDLAIKDALVVDGGGEKGYKAHVYIKDGRIAEISADSELSACDVIAAEGLVLCPGFIDLHTHSDVSPYCAPGFESALAQGVTFHLAGNCGSSLVPNTERDHVSHANSMSIEKFGRLLGDEGYQANDLLSYRDEVTNLGLAINFGTLVGHGRLRACVMDNPDNVIPTRREMEEMTALLTEQLSQGAFGMSLGLTYKPGIYSKTEELIRFAKVIAEHDLVLTSHIRSEGDKIFDALSEMRRIAEVSGVHIHISHLKLMHAGQWGRAEELLALIDEMRTSGIRITCDQYPYCASSTGFTSLLPNWAKQGSNEDIVSRLKDEKAFAEMRSEIEDNINHRGGPTSIVAAYTCGGMPECDGKSLSEAAKMLNVQPEEAYRQILIASRCRASGVYFAMSERDVDRIASRQDFAVASDGYGYDILSAPMLGKPHPRSAGAFVRFLRLAIERQLMPMEKAIYKMTSLPATILGLQDRGMIVKNAPADVVLFDPEAASDNATFECPGLPPSGIKCVLVNGIKAFDDGKPLGIRSGRFLRSSKGA